MLRKVFGVIKLSQICVTITKLLLIKYIFNVSFSYTRQIDTPKCIFGKRVINASRYLYMILYLGTIFFF